MPARTGGAEKVPSEQLVPGLLEGLAAVAGRWIDPGARGSAAVEDGYRRLLDAVLRRLFLHAARQPGLVPAAGPALRPELEAELAAMLDGLPVLARGSLEPDQLGEVYEWLLGLRPQLGPGGLALRPGDARRRTGSHYTPRSMTDPIVRRTLEPLLAGLADGGPPSSQALLGLRVCDPAMGGGAFLLAACRRLAEAVVEAWEREGALAGITATHGSASRHARRLVARHCLYGVDRDPVAVAVARMSLWLEVGSPGEPSSFVDHRLRCGDALVGLSAAQLRGLSWEPSAEAVELGPDPHDAPERARIAGDVLVGAFFAHARAAARRAELALRRAELAAWLGRAPVGPPPIPIERWAHAARDRLRPFHWPVEFPELLSDPRPLAIVGNPPFMGKNAIRAAGGPSQLPWLLALHPGAHGNADLSAHFLRRAASLIASRGTIGFIATNTIAQGDTRASGLRALLRDGFVIYDATSLRPWPGEASVCVSVVHLAKGLPRPPRAPRLDDRAVVAIDSRLRPVAERPEPRRLHANLGIGFVGSYVLGMGFTLTPEQRDALVAEDPRHAERIKPYLGGAELNSSPTQGFMRYVIDLGDLSLEQARGWPRLLEIVEREVKPERDRNNREAYRRYWWQFGEKRPALQEALRSCSRCLVTPRVSKHLVVAFQPVGRVFSEQLDVFVLDRHAHLALLQSRIHERWARRLSSSLEDRLRYSVSACFETLPLPDELASLEAIGERLDGARAAVMVRRGIGLTKLYNGLRAPAGGDPELDGLRVLHEELDRAVLRAYGWSALEVPPYSEPTTAREAEAWRRFDDAVVERLHELNARRAAEEASLGEPAKGEGITDAPRQESTTSMPSRTGGSEAGDPASPTRSGATPGSSAVDPGRGVSATTR
ncbi:MAG: hypothetical protein KC501_37475 [Myxococcales bacterium]|nr:hypothetical protein [Myxococcales bacterium]